MATDGIRVAARDLHRGDVLAKRRWIVLSVERPLSDSGTIRVVLVKPKSGRRFERELAADELIRVIRGAPS